MGADKLQPVHPGEILLEEFMKPLGISPASLAEDLGLEPDAVGGLSVATVQLRRKRRCDYHGVSGPPNGSG